MAERVVEPPALTQSVVAQHTDDIRLRRMANSLPWRDPVRVAEETAILDVVSDGRAGIGVGTGLDPRQAETLGQYWGGSARDSARNHHSVRERFEVLVSALTEDDASHHGQFHDVPPSYTEWGTARSSTASRTTRASPGRPTT